MLQLEHFLHTSAVGQRQIQPRSLHSKLNVHIPVVEIDEATDPTAKRLHSKA